MRCFTSSSRIRTQSRRTMPSTDPSARSALWCVVPAAGRGTRFGSTIPKQYLPLAGKPLLLHTLERLAAHPRIAGLVVALAPRDPHWPQLTQLSGKPVRIVEGGDERADSVLAGLAALAQEIDADDFVL